MEYGLIGEKLGHSWSPMIHGMLGDYTYEMIPLTPDRLTEFVNGRQYAGLNVTIPYKRAVMPMCDKIAESARKIGSVNTLVCRGGELIGYNTDYDGFIYMLRRAAIDVKGKKVLLLGNGGTARTARAALADLGASRIVTAVRDIQKVSESLPADTVIYTDYANIGEYGDSEIIINTTPVGMYPANGETLIDLSKFKSCIGVADVIYNPLKTRLILEAESSGIAATNGLPMLAAQAKRAAELFLDSKKDDGIIEKVIHAITRKMSNIVLIGMPGCGKTHLGAMLADSMGREHIDMDRYIENAAGMSIPDIFEKGGEKSFRTLETAAAAEIGKKNGIVISTGGGVVLTQENIYALRQNGILVFTERDTACLSREGRPLSSDIGALEKMYEERYPLYISACDIMVNNDGLPEDTLKKIYAELERIK